MKITSQTARLTFIAAVLFGLLTSSASAVQNQEIPIPGVDIIVKKKPHGIALHATSGQNGAFVFDNLTAGTYELSVAQPQIKSTAINTTRSNIKHPGKRLENGVQVFTAAIEMGTGPASADIEITAAHGKITGTVTRADALKPGGTQPVRENPKDAKPAR